jgi:hypothetical protein
MDQSRPFMRRGLPFPPKPPPGNISGASQDSFPPGKEGLFYLHLFQETHLELLKVLSHQGMSPLCIPWSQFMRRGPPFPPSPPFPPRDVFPVDPQNQFMRGRSPFPPEKNAKSFSRLFSTKECVPNEPVYEEGLLFLLHFLQESYLDYSGFISARE